MFSMHLFAIRHLFKPETHLQSNKLEQWSQQWFINFSFGENIAL